MAKCKPFYQRMARLYNEQAKDNNKVIFAKADATGEIGKELGRYLGIDSVPNFIFFKGGKRYGTPLAISRLPSSTLERALVHLEDGLDWDAKAIQGSDSEEPKSGSSIF